MAGNKFYNPAWEDMQVSVGRLTFPGSSDPTWRAWNMGVGGGVTFDVLGFAVNDLVDFDIQTSHSMILDSILDVHIHYSTPTDGTGDKFKFQLDVVAGGINGAWAVPTGSPFTAEKTISTDDSNSHRVFQIAEIPAVNTTLSSIYSCKLTRIAASADEYSGEIYLKYIDGHYQKDGIGSAQENSKLPA